MLFHGCLDLQNEHSKATMGISLAAFNAFFEKTFGCSLHSARKMLIEVANNNESECETNLYLEDIHRKHIPVR